MPEFIPILIAGLLLFTGLLLVFGGFFYPITDSDYSRNYSYVVSEDKMEIGKNIIVSDYTDPDSVKKLRNITVMNGLVSGKSERDTFMVDDLEDIFQGSIEIDVKDTNLYGPLMIYINNELVFRKYSRKGTHVVRYPASLLNDSNDIDIIVGSSGWRIWAPTVYNFDADFDVIYYGTNQFNKTLDLTEDDFKTLTKAKVAVDVNERKGRGEIVVTLNDEEIYSGYGTKGRMFDIDFFEDDENILYISTEEDAYFDVDVDLLLWK